MSTGASASPKRGKAQKKAPSTSSGRALGRITGVNHVVLVAKDMEETVRFYQDVLGLKAKATTYGARSGAGLSRGKREPEIAPGSLYFFEVGNGDLIGFIALPGIDTQADASFYDRLWPAGGRLGARPQKMDHLALTVESREDLAALRQRLLDHGIAVSDIDPPRSAPYVSSIYFYDPNGVALEVATYDYADPAWKTRTPADMFRSPDPVPSLKMER